MAAPPSLALLLADHGQLPSLTDLMDARGDGMGGDPRRRTDRERGADRVGVALLPEAGDVREPAVNRRHRVPEVALGAAEAGMARADRPARPRVPQEDRARRVRRRPLAPDVVQAPPLAGRFVVEPLDELSGVEVRALRALI